MIDVLASADASCTPIAQRVFVFDHVVRSQCESSCASSSSDFREQILQALRDNLALTMRLKEIV